MTVHDKPASGILDAAADTEPQMTNPSQRRWAHEQALASTRLSGHTPRPEFLADCEAVIEGTMTHDQAAAASLARALAKDAEALAKSDRCVGPGAESSADTDC